MRTTLAWAAAAAAAAAALALPACAGVTTLPVPAQRGHAQCPLGGTDERTLLVDSAADWRALGLPDEAAALGRAVDWPRERVLVHALAQQPTLGVRVDAVALAAQPEPATPRLGLRVTGPAPGTMAATALSRPCVVVAVARDAGSTWRLVDADRPERAIATASVGPAAAGPRKFPHAASVPGANVLQPLPPAAPR